VPRSPLRPRPHRRVRRSRTARTAGPIRAGRRLRPTAITATATATGGQMIRRPPPTPRRLQPRKRQTTRPTTARTQRPGRTSPTRTRTATATVTASSPPRRLPSCPIRQSMPGDGRSKPRRRPVSRPPARVQPLLCRADRERTGRRASRRRLPDARLVRRSRRSPNGLAAAARPRVLADRPPDLGGGARRLLCARAAYVASAFAFSAANSSAVIAPLSSSSLPRAI
jgi:hypothetical protein